MLGSRLDQTGILLAYPEGGFRSSGGIEISSKFGIDSYSLSGIYNSMIVSELLKREFRTIDNFELDIREYKYRLQLIRGTNGSREISETRWLFISETRDIQS